MTTFRNILGQSWTLKFHKVKSLKFKIFKFNLNFLCNWSFLHRTDQKGPNIMHPSVLQWNLDLTKILEVTKIFLKSRLLMTST